jgi:hypothetical protein
LKQRHAAELAARDKAGQAAVARSQAKIAGGDSGASH